MPQTERLQHLARLAHISRSCSPCQTAADAVVWKFTGTDAPRKVTHNTAVFFPFLIFFYLPCVFSLHVCLVSVCPWWTSLVLPGDKVVWEQSIDEKSHCNGVSPASTRNSVGDRWTIVCVSQVWSESTHKANAFTEDPPLPQRFTARKSQAFSLLA